MNLNQTIIINRIWAMSSPWTFSIKPIKNLLDRYISPTQKWCDPFAGKYSPAQIKNDLNGEHEFCMDALDFLKTRKDGEFDGVLLDPPYSYRQVSEHYKKAGIKVTSWHTSAGYNSALKNEVKRILKPGGFVICFAWNSTGMGKNREFKIIEILLVCHGSYKNDTIVVVEKQTDKVQKN